MAILLLDGSVVAGGACTRDNPAFAGGSDGTAAAASSTSTGGGEVADDTNNPVTTSPSETSEGTTHAIDGTGTTATSMTDTTDDATEGTTGEEPVCMLHPAAPIQITVQDGSGAVISPDCELSEVTSVGNITVTGNTISHQVCAGCTCKEGGAIRTLHFGASLSPPAELAGCGALAFWADPEPTGAAVCEWRGFAVFDAGPPLPVYVGSNSRFLPQAIFNVVEVGLADEALCLDDPARCLPSPGRHGLTFANDTPVLVGNPQTVPIAFVVGLPFFVTNRMASVTPECREQVSWTALYEP